MITEQNSLIMVRVYFARNAAPIPARTEGQEPNEELADMSHVSVRTGTKVRAIGISRQVAAAAPETLSNGELMLC